MKMITVGIDTEEIARFTEWTKYSKERLLRIFSEEELSYCLEEPVKTLERMAARFAAKEAFYKAVTNLLLEPKSFMQVSTLCSVKKHANGTPELVVNWAALELPEYSTQISLTHTSQVATALVVIVNVNSKSE
jgi:holo-[acyl-carrier protein] synthase